MGMFNIVLDSFKGEIFDFKVKRQGLIAGTVNPELLPVELKVSKNGIFLAKNLLWYFCPPIKVM